MPQLGKYNDLKILKEVDFGVYLDGEEEFGEVLLPKRYLPRNIQIGENIQVFLYTDSEDLFIATTEKPHAIVGECAYLEVVSVNSFGAFLDWGLSKDLLLPLNEQTRKLKVGDFCIVRVFLDEKTNRIAASQKLPRFLNQIKPVYKYGEEVSILITHQTDLGYSAIVNHEHRGLIFESDIFEKLQTGETRKGFIKYVRDDGKIDLTLEKPGYEKIGGVADQILNRLREENGFLPLTDKTAPETIYKELKISKKNFKKAIGALYKKRLILIESDGIRLT